MRINIREDSIEIEGYVNAVERSSKPLWSRLGQFVERIKKGAFARAIKRNNNIRILLNHDKDRDLGGTKEGNLKLHEDSIGLHAQATITDPEVIELGRRGELIGWSFGFMDMPDGVDESVDEETKLPLRLVKDLNLTEVSILDRTKTPAYDGTLIMARSNDEVEYFGEAMLDDVEVHEEVREEQPQHAPEHEAIDTEEPDLSLWEQMLIEMKGEKHE